MNKLKDESGPPLGRMLGINEGDTGHGLLRGLQWFTKDKPMNTAQGLNMLGVLQPLAEMGPFAPLALSGVQGMLGGGASGAATKQFFSPLLSNLGLG